MKEFQAYNEQIGIPIDDFIEQHIKLAHKVANRYLGRLNHTLDQYDDVLQLALVGMVKAYKNFNPKEYNTKFSTYAVPMMLGEIQRYFRDYDTLVKFPRIFKQIWRAVAKYDLEEETYEVIAEKTGYELRFVEKAMPYYEKSRALSINQQCYDSGQGDTEITIQDRLASYEDFTNIIVNDFINTLDERDQLILKMTLIDDATQSEIGKVIGVSQVQVSRLLKKIKEDLKVYMEVS